WPHTSSYISWVPRGAGGRVRAGMWAEWRPLPVEDPPPQDAFQLVTAQRTGAGTTINVGRGAAGLFFVYIGVPLLLIGILLLVVAGLVAQGAASFNQACSTNPLCTPAPDPCGGFAAGGVLILLIGIGVVAYGFSQYRDQ
ncbi:MAG TPA: hypothetical protein VKT21_05955, partial [Thermoplasmata archaeon]|nr:hypothetical protein [Thermoplasmata archaeon]